MASFIDSLPPGFLTSTSGNGFALIGALIAGGVTFHFTKDGPTSAAVATGTASTILLSFPQRGAKPADPATVKAEATTLEQAIEVIAGKVAEGEKAKSALAAITAPKPPAAVP
jgi:hypothetical protein